MSEENVEAAVWIETARRAIEAWNREDLDVFLEEWHPDANGVPLFRAALKESALSIVAARALRERGTESAQYGRSIGSRPRTRRSSARGSWWSAMSSHAGRKAGSNWTRAGADSLPIATN
jgi:hypothetical protein